MTSLLENKYSWQYVALLADGKGDQINQAYAHIRTVNAKFCQPDLHRR